jgi:hypothetical protein
MVSQEVTIINNAIIRLHELVLKQASKLSDEQLAWRANLHTPPISFHLWHIARWADRLQGRIPGMSPVLMERLGKSTEIWETEKLTGAWKVALLALGFGDTGMEMSHDIAANFAVPSKSILIDYLHRTLTAAERAIGAIDAEQFLLKCTNLYDEEGIVGQSLVGHMGHISRHLGMIEALIGVQDMEGTITV